MLTSKTISSQDFDAANSHFQFQYDNYLSGSRSYVVISIYTLSAGTMPQLTVDTTRTVVIDFNMVLEKAYGPFSERYRNATRTLL